MLHASKLSQHDYLLRREPIQAALTVVLDQPQCTIWRLRDVADAKTNRPVLGRFRSRAVHFDPVQGAACEAGRERGTLPSGKHRAAVEHQAARRENRRPVDHRLGEVRARVGTCNGHAVVVHRIGHKRPTIVFARLDQVELVAAAWPVLKLPQAAIRREREAVGCAMP